MRALFYTIASIIGLAFLFAVLQQPHVSAQQAKVPIGKVVAACPNGGDVDKLAIAVLAQSYDEIVYTCTGQDNQQYIRLVSP